MPTSSVKHGAVHVNSAAGRARRPQTAPGAAVTLHKRRLSARRSPCCWFPTTEARATSRAVDRRAAQTLPLEVRMTQGAGAHGLHSSLKSLLVFAQTKRARHGGQKAGGRVLRLKCQSVFF